MKAFSMRRMIVIGWCATAAMSIGCASGNRAEESTKALDSMQGVSEKLASAKENVTRVTTALDQLSSGADLQKSFDDYSSAVKDLQTAGQDAGERGAAMRARRQEYLDKWQKEVGEVQNPAVQQSLMARKQRVADEFDKVRGLGDDVKSAYVPFLQDNQDIQKALAIDLTPAGVTSLKPVIDKSKADGAALSAKLDAINAEVTSLQGTLSPTGAPPVK